MFSLSPARDSANATVSITVSPVSKADLKVTVTDTKTIVVAGSKDIYVIKVTNSGPSAVTGAKVTDTFPANFISVTYTATRTGQASGFRASGTGNINDTVTMPSGSTITYTAKGTVSSSATGTLSNTAMVAAPSGVSDPNSANNSATDTTNIKGKK